VSLSATLRGWARPLVRRLPAEWRVVLRRVLRHGLGPHDAEMRGAQENERFASESEVHDLPPIYHYWSNTYLRPTLEAHGFSNPDQFFAQALVAARARVPDRPARFISLGSGNGDTELRVAALLREAGCEDYTLECVDLSPAMLERGRRAAEAAGFGDRLLMRQADLNTWRPDGAYDAVMANQSLHHVAELEALFDAVHAAIGDRGRFVVSDMIGRNGHQRWPEALAIVQEFWAELPKPCRYNLQLHRHEQRYRNWDCSVEGFEGIRAQDILPLMVERFGFEFFLAYGNVIDPFIDRSFGPHFDPDRAWDRAFIDRVQARDEAEIRSRRITPTHLMAVLGADAAIAPRCALPHAPADCIRRPG